MRNPMPGSQWPTVSTSRTTGPTRLTRSTLRSTSLPRVDKGPNEPLAHFAAAVVAVWKRDLAKAKVDAGRALELNPNYALAYGTLGQVEVYLGHPLEALPFIERAIRLDPAFSQQYTHFLGSAYFGAGRYEKAARTFRERIRLSPRTDVSRVFLAFALGHLGEMQEAHGVWRELVEINPSYCLAEHLARLPFQQRAGYREDQQRPSGRRTAGLKRNSANCRVAISWSPQPG